MSRLLVVVHGQQVAGENDRNFRVGVGLRADRLDREQDRRERGRERTARRASARPACPGRAAIATRSLKWPGPVSDRLPAEVRDPRPAPGPRRPGRRRRQADFPPQSTPDSTSRLRLKHPGCFPVPMKARATRRQRRHPDQDGNRGRRGRIDSRPGHRRESLGPSHGCTPTFLDPQDASR